MAMATVHHYWKKRAEAKRSGKDIDVIITINSTGEHWETAE